MANESTTAPLLVLWKHFVGFTEDADDASRSITLHMCVSEGKRYEIARQRTGTGPHLPALAPEPPRPLFLPLLSHSVEKGKENTSEKCAQRKTGVHELSDDDVEVLSGERDATAPKVMRTCGDADVQFM